MVSRNLPEFPNLELLRKRAKALLGELQQNNQQAKLSEAQLLVARRYGFPSWTRLKMHVESLPRPAMAAAVEQSAGSGGGGVGGTSATGGGDSGPGLFVRFTQKARRMVFFARYWAAKRESANIEPEHLLLGLLQEDVDFIKRLLGKPFADPRILAAIEGTVAVRQEIGSVQPIPLSDDSRRVLQFASAEADRLGHAEITIGHFWLALLAGERSPAVSILVEILKENGVSIDTARERIANLIREEL
jgi:ATP-dependent Clp protease ATP-binding subunit ClpC